MKLKQTKHSDKVRFDFIERNQVSIDNNSYFTCLTQHISIKRVKDLREFCDYGIEMERMFKKNNIIQFGGDWSWFIMSGEHKQIYYKAWFNERRAVNQKEKDKIRREQARYEAACAKVMGNVKFDISKYTTEDKDEN